MLNQGFTCQWKRSTLLVLTSNHNLRLVSFSFCSFVVVFYFSSLFIGSLLRKSSFADSEGIVVDRKVAELGQVEPGSHIASSFKITNLSGKEIRLVTFAASCSCVTVSGVPSVLANQAVQEVLIEIEAPRDTGELTGWVRILTDNPEAPGIQLAYEATVSNSK